MRHWATFHSTGRNIRRSKPVRERDVGGRIERGLALIPEDRHTRRTGADPFGRREI